MSFFFSNQTYNNNNAATCGVGQRPCPKAGVKIHETPTSHRQGSHMSGGGYERPPTMQTRAGAVNGSGATSRGAAAPPPVYMQQQPHSHQQPYYAPPHQQQARPVQPQQHPPQQRQQRQQAAPAAAAPVPPPMRAIAPAAAAPVMSNAVAVARPTVTTVVDYQKTQLKDISLDIRDYSVEGLFGLFNISFHEVNALNEDAMKRANKIRLMMHPDKSRLHEKYFLFFTEAYGRLKEIYEYINKEVSGKDREKQYAARQYAQVESSAGGTGGGQMQMHDRDDVGASSGDLDNYSAELHELMKRTMHVGGKLDSQKFNESFEKYRGEDPNARGYGDWLKSNQDMIDMGGKVTRGNMSAMFEEQRKKQQSLIVYTGVTDLYATGSYGTSLNDDDTQNYTFHGAEGGTKGPGGAGAPSLQFTDLRQAHTETLIPVTQEDYERMPKFRNLNEYKSHRDSVKFDHGTDAVNKQRLRDQQARSEQEAMALAYKHAQQLDKARNNERNFLAELKRITGY